MAPGATGPLKSPLAERFGEEVHLRISRADLYLIECGLKALAYAPGYDYDHVLSARSLAKKLEAAIPAMSDAELARREEPLAVP